MSHVQQDMENHITYQKASKAKLLRKLKTMLGLGPVAKPTLGPRPTTGCTTSYYLSASDFKHSFIYLTHILPCSGRISSHFLQAFTELYSFSQLEFYWLGHWNASDPQIGKPSDDSSLLLQVKLFSKAGLKSLWMFLASTKCIRRTGGSSPPIQKALVLTFSQM
jgi:hypothetical protein